MIPDTRHGTYSDSEYYPKMLADWTPQQHQEAVNHLAQQPLKTLRLKQHLVAKQIAYCLDKMKKYSVPDETGNLIPLMDAEDNLQHMARHITTAIYQREFDE